LHKNCYISFLSLIALIFISQVLYAQTNSNKIDEPTNNVNPSVVEPLQKIYPFEQDKYLKETPAKIDEVENSANPLAKENISTEIIQNVKPLYNQDKTIYFYLYLSMILLIGYVRASYGNYLSAIQKSVFNTNLAQQFHRSQSATVAQPFSMMFIFNLLSISTLLYLITQNFSDFIFTAPIQHFFVILMVVSGYHIFKLIANSLLSNVFKLKNVLGFYQFNFFLVEVAICVVLIPLLLLATFNTAFSAKTLLIIALVIFIAGHFYAYFKGILSSFRIIVFHKFYFFLYFCILEIGPFIVLYKIMNNWLMIG